MNTTPIFSTKVILAMILTVISFIAVAFAETEWLALLGVVLTSLSMGLGETALVGYLTRFHRSCISSWSSGTGGAGLIGTISYSTMKQIGISNKKLMLCMISVPIFEAMIFWGLLRHRKIAKRTSECKETTENEDENNDVEEQKIDLSAPTIMDRIRFIPKLLKYMIPLFIVYFSQYFINQGLVSETLYQ